MSAPLWVHEYTSGQTHADFEFPTGGDVASYFQAVGAGTVVLVNVGGTVLTAHCVGGEVIPGSYTSLTSTSCQYLRMGNGTPPPAIPQGTTAAGVTIADAGAFTTQEQLEGATQEIYQSLKTTQGQIALSPSDFYLLTGAPLAIFSNGASAVPGSAIVDSKAFAVRWNNNATLNGILTSFAMPTDCDITANMTLTIYASKVGATIGDAVTFDVGAFNQVVGALHDADSDFGGTTSAMTGDATSKTEQAVTLTLALANLAAAPARVTLTIKPTDGTLGTDDLCMLGATIAYKKKLLAS